MSNKLTELVSLAFILPASARAPEARQRAGVSKMCVVTQHICLKLRLRTRYVLPAKRLSNYPDLLLKLSIWSEASRRSTEPFPRFLSVFLAP